LAIHRKINLSASTSVTLRDIRGIERGPLNDPSEHELRLGIARTWIWYQLQALDPNSQVL
jgi:hypothetical protein